MKLVQPFLWVSACTAIFPNLRLLASLVDSSEYPLLQSLAYPDFGERNETLCSILGPILVSEEDVQSGCLVPHPPVADDDESEEKSLKRCAFRRAKRSLRGDSLNPFRNSTKEGPRVRVVRFDSSVDIEQGLRPLARQSAEHWSDTPTTDSYEEEFPVEKLGKVLLVDADVLLVESNALLVNIFLDNQHISRSDILALSRVNGVAPVVGYGTVPSSVSIPLLPSDDGNEYPYVIVRAECLSMIEAKNADARTRSAIEKIVVEIHVRGYLLGALNYSDMLSKFCMTSEGVRHVNWSTIRKSERSLESSRELQILLSFIA